MNEEWVLLKPRARNFKTILYVASIAIKGTENDLRPQCVLYSPNPAFLTQIVAEHNNALKAQKAKVEKEKVDKENKD